MKQIQKIAPFAAMAVGAMLALATSAFNNAPHKTRSGDTMYTFEYNAPDNGTDYSETSVKNVSNWSYTSDNSGCGNHDVKACRIFVPETYVDDPGGSNTLDASIDISTGGTSSQAYVSSTDAGSGDDYVSNKLN